MSTFNLANRVKIVNPSANVDSDYGPYESTEAANLAIPEAVREKGKTVGIIDAISGRPIDYWYKLGTSDEDLSPKVPMGVDIMEESAECVVFHPQEFQTDSGTKIKEVLERSFSNTIYLNNAKVSKYENNKLTVSGTEVNVGKDLSGEVMFTNITITPTAGALFTIGTDIEGYNRPNACWAQVTAYSGGTPVVLANVEAINGVKVYIENIHPTQDVTEISIKYIYL